MGLFCIWFFRKKLGNSRIALTFLCLASLVTMLGLSGCGDNTPSTKVQTYIITVTGTSGASQQTAELQLIVK